jgi:hypothetical protein
MCIIMNKKDTYEYVLNADIRHLVMAYNLVPPCVVFHQYYDIYSMKRLDVPEGPGMRKSFLY